MSQDHEIETDRADMGPGPTPVASLDLHAHDLHVFPWHSRKDLATAEALRDRLIAQGFGAYLDKHDILPGYPWKERLAQLIETADRVVFPISPARPLRPCATGR